MTWSCYFQTFIHVMMMHFSLRLTTYIQHIGRGGRNSEMQCDAFCTSIAPAFGVQTFLRKLKSIVGMPNFVGKFMEFPLWIYRSYRQTRRYHWKSIGKGTSETQRN